MDDIAIQIANQVSQNEETSSLYDVTIYLQPGDYFLFSCFNKFVEDYVCEIPDGVTDFCVQMANQLAERVIEADNINFYLKSACLFSELSNEEQVKFFPEFTEDELEDLEEIQTLKELCDDGERPMFHIMDPYFKFNITSMMQIDGVDFSGVEAAGRFTSNQYPPANRLPKRKCQLSLGLSSEAPQCFNEEDPFASSPFFRDSDDYQLQLNFVMNEELEKESLYENFECQPSLN